MGFWTELGEGLAQAVYPENLYCMACGDIGEFQDTWGLCGRCLSRLFSEDNLRGTMGKDCEGRSFSRILACTVYGGLSKEILWKFKNKSQPWLGKNLGQLMAERFREEVSGNGSTMTGGSKVGRGHVTVDCVTFVPMYGEKKRLRGYDQAQLLAEQVGRSLGVPCIDCLVRMRKTEAMKNMSEEQRRRNVEGAFGWKGLHSRRRAVWSGKVIPQEKEFDLCGKRVILVDDIITTGSTAEACASVLRQQGADDVTVLAFAAAAHQQMN